MAKEKSVSRSSSGIGTASHNSRNMKKSSDDSSRCFSPELKNDILVVESDDGKDNLDGDNHNSPAEKFSKKLRKKQLSDNKFGSLKSIRKALSKKNLFKAKKDRKEIIDENGKYEITQKTPILEKYGRKSLAENDDEEFGSYTEEDETYSLSDFEENEIVEEKYSRIDKSSKRKTLSQNRLDIENENNNHEKKYSTSSNGKYLKKYKGDIVYSSDEDSANTDIDEDVGEVKVKERYFQLHNFYFSLKFYILGSIAAS